MNVSFLSIRSNTNVYSKEVVPGSENTYDDLNNYTVYPENVENEAILPIVLELTLDQSNAVIPNGATILNYQLQLLNLLFENMFGNIGQIVINALDGQLPLGFFQTLIDGTFHFADPSLNIVISNSFGVPLAINMSSMGVFTSDVGIINFEGTGIPSHENPLIIEYPNIDEIGEIMATSFILNSDNSNIQNILASNPEELFFSASAITNPEGHEDYNFVSRLSQYEVALEFVLPLFGHTDMLVLQDIFSFVLPEILITNIEEVQNLIFRTHFKNSFPVEITSQVYFTNQAFQISDSVFARAEKVGGITGNQNGQDVNVIETGPIDVEFSPDRIQDMENVQYMIVKVRINTTNIPEDVKFYLHQNLEFYLGVIAGLEFQTDELIDQ